MVDATAAPPRVARSRRTRPWALLTGAAVVAAAVAPPMHSSADAHLSAHMVQHVLLLTVAPPLLVVGSRRGPATSRWLTLALLIHTGVLWAWHIPALYDAAVDAAALHGVEHLSLLVAGGLLWWALGVGNGEVRAGAVPVLFLAGLTGTALGAAMTLASHPWYQGYPSLTDQQLAGVVMWGFAGALYALAGGGLVVAWLARDDR